MHSRLPQAGSALIELGFCLPILVGLALGALQFGYSFYVYSKLEQATRNAARYASLRTYASATATPDAAYVTAVQNAAVFANPAGGTLAIAPDLTTDNISVSISFVNSVPAKVTVSVVNYALPQIIGSVRLINKPRAQFPYLGIFAPAT
jgi:Flp pilus assembly protein TadG